MKKLTFPLFALILALLLAGCGDDDNGDSNGDMTDDTTADTAMDTTSDTPADMPNDMAGDTPDDTPSDMQGDTPSDGDDMVQDTGDTSDMDPQDMTADMDPDMDPMGACPTDTLPESTSVTYQGSTVGSPNLFESNRLEWDDAGDNALLYVVPETGTYEFSLNDNLTDNGGCGVSILNRTNMSDVFHTPALCPDMGSITMLPDAYFIAGEGFADTADLTAGQELLVLVSCAYWSMPDKEVAYTLGIALQ